MNNRKSLESIIDYAAKYVPYYKRVLSNVNWIESEEFLTKIPLLEKNEALLNENDLISDEYHTFPKNEKISVRRTSGSTGKSLRVCWDTDDDRRSLMPLWFYRKKYYDISPEDKYCYFFSFDYESDGVENSDIKIDKYRRCIGINKALLSDERIESVCKSLYEFQPKWMMAQPSTCILIAEWFKKNNLCIPEFKYIELTGELLTDNVLELIRDTFHCKVSNQYGCNEANSIAFECPEGNLHCLESNVIVEVIDEQGCRCGENVEGDIYITTLNNHCMPFIRYGIGDRGTISHSTCKCGSKAKVIKLSSGRNTEFVKYRDGSKESIYIFMKPVEIINEKYGNVILQCQIVQKEYEQFTIRIVLNDFFKNWRETIEELYYDFLDLKGKEKMKFVFEFKEQLIPDEKSRKLRYFICEI